MDSPQYHTIFALPDSLAETAKELLKQIELSDRVHWHNDPNRHRVVFEAAEGGSLLVGYWSLGEQLVWSFLLSLAGHQQINLRQLLDYYSNTDQAPLIGQLLLTALGLAESEAGR